MIVDLGCGNNTVKKHSIGVVGVDKESTSDADIVTDLEKTPWSFLEDASVDVFYANHFFEHVRCLEDVLREIMKKAKHKAELKTRFPYYNHSNAYGDPGHKRILHPMRFERHPYFYDINKQLHYPSPRIGRLVKYLNVVSRFQPDEWQLNMKIGIEP